MCKYSIVVPLHNEQENVTDLYDRLKAVMEASGEPFEIVLVDDGSRDRTFDLLRQIAAVDSRVVVVKLRRNFGQTSALAAGFDNARGEYVIAMDGDLQHDHAAVDGGNLFQQAIGAIRRTIVDEDQLKCVPHLLHNGLQSVVEGGDTLFFVMERNDDGVFRHIQQYTAAGS